MGSSPRYGKPFQDPELKEPIYGPEGLEYGFGDTMVELCRDSDTLS